MRRFLPYLLQALNSDSFNWEEETACCFWPSLPGSDRGEVRELQVHNKLSSFCFMAGFCLLLGHQNLLKILKDILPPGLLITCVSHRDFNVPFPLLCRERSCVCACQSFTRRAPSQLLFFLKDRFPSPAALLQVQMLAQHWRTPARWNAFCLYGIRPGECNQRCRQVPEDPQLLQSDAL